LTAARPMIEADHREAGKEGTTVGTADHFQCSHQ